MVVVKNVTTTDFVKAVWLSWGKFPGLAPCAAFVAIPCFITGFEAVATGFIIFMSVTGVAASLGIGIWRFKNNPFFKYDLNYSWDGNGILLKSDNGEWRYPWSDVLKVKEDHSMLLIWVAKGIFHIIPKRCFTDHDAIQKFQDAVVASGVPFVRSRGIR